MAGAMALSHTAQRKSAVRSMRCRKIARIYPTPPGLNDNASALTREDFEELRTFEM